MKIKQCVVSLVLVAAMATPAFAFSDVYDADLTIDIATLESMGIVNGYTDGTYKPNNTVTRAEFCAFTMRLVDDYSATGFGERFTDVSVSHWAYSDIMAAEELGYFQGPGDGTFSPDSNVTVAQAVTVILRVLGYTTADVGLSYPTDNMNFAANLGLLDDINKTSDQDMTRADVATLIMAALQLDSTNLLNSYDSRVSDIIPMSQENGVLTCFNGSSYVTYTLDEDLPEELLEYGSGTLLFESGKVAGFVPDGDEILTWEVTGVDADGLTLASGTSYDLDSDVMILMDGEVDSYGSYYYLLSSASSVKVFLDDYGDVSWIMPDTYGYMDGYVVTGIYESADPNLSKPETIEVAGASFDISSSVSVSFSAYDIGDRIHIYLDENGEVTKVAAYSASTNEDMIGILDGNSVTLTCGVTLSGTVSSSSCYDGYLVKVSQSTSGKLSVSNVSNTTKYDLDISGMSLGSYDVSTAVQVYECVGTSAATQIALEDILIDTVDSDQVLYYHLDDNGDVDILLLDDVTGNCYTYGYIEVTTKTSSGLSSTDKITNYYWTIENSNDNNPEASGNVLSSKDGELAGMVVDGEDKTESIVYLTSTGEVSRDSFTTSYLGGFLISDDVQVYSEMTESWVTLEYALATSDTFEAYYDRDVEDGGQIRVIVAY